MCPWQYRFVPAIEGGQRLQIVPPGVSGVVHCQTKDLVIIGEGDSTNPAAPIIEDHLGARIVVDVRFTDGLWVGHVAGGGTGDGTVYFRVD
jgi:hypothetical protein